MTRSSKHLSLGSVPSSPASLSSLRSKLSFPSSRSRSSSCNSDLRSLSPSSDHTPTAGCSCHRPPELKVSNITVPPPADPEMGPLGGDEENQRTGDLGRTRLASIRTKGDVATRGREEEEDGVAPAVELEGFKPRPNSLDLPPSPGLNPIKSGSRTRFRPRSAPRTVKFTSSPLTEAGRGYSIATLMESLPFEQVPSGKLLEYQIRQEEKERTTQVIVNAEVLGWQKSKKRPQARRDNSYVDQRKKQKEEEVKVLQEGRPNLTEWTPFPPQLYTAFAQLYENDVDCVSSLLS
ncbi:hypothetical protein JCM3765_001318 [Sporobolomyces pararoseus]